MNLTYALQVNSSPYAGDGGLTAYHFALAAIRTGHQVLRIFFYQEGIYHALRFALPPDDEIKIGVLWSALAREHQVDLVVCISAAQRRGLLCADEARRQAAVDNHLADGFRIAGLGQWLEASLQADRCLVFG